MLSCQVEIHDAGLPTVTSTPSSARMRAAYDEASSAVDIVMFFLRTRLSDQGQMEGAAGLFDIEPFSTWFCAEAKGVSQSLMP